MLSLFAFTLTCKLYCVAVKCLGATNFSRQIWGIFAKQVVYVSGHKSVLADKWLSGLSSLPKLVMEWALIYHRDTIQMHIFSDLVKVLVWLFGALFAVSEVGRNRVCHLNTCRGLFSHSSPCSKKLLFALGAFKYQNQAFLWVHVHSESEETFTVNVKPGRNSSVFAVST